uniref:Uncharacterized protein n=1 Tax=Cucumis melo TaxID=3656 RepID=A0A9I9EFL5_CUCME
MTKLGDSGEVAGETDHYTVVGLEEEAEFSFLPAGPYSRPSPSPPVSSCSPFKAAAPSPTLSSHLPSSFIIFSAVVRLPTNTFDLVL